MRVNKGAVAAGHRETAEAAELILQDGGNAFDAVVAAHLAACVAEPALSSLAGGGFLLAGPVAGNTVLYDFFVQTPRQKNMGTDLQFYPISADFGTVQQEFHIGPGSVATPGTVKGLFAIHQDLCTMPLKRLAEPAIDLARRGVVVNRFQSRIFEIIQPIFLSSPDSREIYRSEKNRSRLTGEGELLKLPDLADFMEELVNHGEPFFYGGDVAESIGRVCAENGGHLTKDDLENYQVFKRKPLRIPYRNAEVHINPPPAAGGILTAFALKLFESADPGSLKFGSAAHLHLLAQIQRLSDKARIETWLQTTEGHPAEKLLDPEYLNLYKNEVRKRLITRRGTTHISIIDKDGNTASLTTSNGEGSGVMIPGSGVMLNNMLGEEDLNPEGFQGWKTDRRMSSMMAPGILVREDGSRHVFGSGGSNRIRTAILQFLVNLIDFNLSPEIAVTSPRIHYENGLLNVEDGFDEKEVSLLIEQYPDHKIWKEKSLFFGGTHAVSFSPDGFSGVGDPRRGGVSVVL